MKNKNKIKKILLTLLICLITLLLIGFVAWFYSYAFTNFIDKFAAKIIFGFIGLLLAYLLIRVCIQRIVEILGENEDDYRNY